MPDGEQAIIETCQYSQAYRCEDCPFRGKIIGAKGPYDSPFVIIGESPGKNELREGIPFVGPSGVVLKAALDQHKEGSYPQPYITNAFKCFPGKDKDPKELHKPTQACSDQLRKEMEAYPRKVILAMGNPALWSTTGNYNLKITQSRGRLYHSGLAEHVVAAVHPAFLLRGGGNFRQFKADVDYAIRLLLGGVPKGVPDTTYSLIETEEDLSSFAWDLATSQLPYVAADYETTGFSHISDRLICAGYSINGTHSYIVPIMDKPETIRYLSIIHSLARAKFIWHNGKFDIKFAHGAGVPEARVDEDTMMQSYALDETRGIHDLETVASDWLGSPNWKGVLKQHIPKGGNYSHVPRHILYEYLAKDLYNTRAAFTIFKDIMDADPVSRFQYYKSLIPASGFLAEVEKNGIPVDLKMVKSNEDRLQGEIDKYKGKFIELAEKSGFQVDYITKGKEKGETKLMNSHVQLKELLWDHLKYKPKNTDRSTEDDVLKELPPDPIIIALRQYRKVQKAKSTYVTNIPKYLQPDGKIHASYLIHGTATGRLSSNRPNVQNIPRDPLIRGQYRALPGRIFIEPDLNQAELRSLACLSGDEELCRIYTTEGLSLHEEVRRDIFGSPADWMESDIIKYLGQFFLKERYNDGKDRIVEEQKMRAKTVNFGIVYGRTAGSLAEEFHVSVQEAQKWIDAWFKRFPAAAKFIENCRMAPIRMQNLRTAFGYRKRFGVVSAERLTDIQNEASNFPHQNTASMINLHGAMRLYKPLKELDTHIINLVHDSILMDAPDDTAAIKEVIRLSKLVLEQVPIDFRITRIPFKADAKVGYRWGSCDDEQKFWAKRMAA